MTHAMDHSGHDPHATPAAAGQGESLLDVLKRRYARGEMTREEYDQVRRDLEG
jgi:uncharacterized membrane protein